MTSEQLKELSNSAYIAALVNQHRAGTLVHIDGPEVEALVEAERERCASIADNFCARDHFEIRDENGSGQTQIARAVAAAIRALRIEGQDR